MTLWYVVGGIFLAALVIVGFVAVNRRAALRRAEEQKQLRAGEAAAVAPATTGERSTSSIVRPVRLRPPPTSTVMPTSTCRMSSSPSSTAPMPRRPVSPAFVVGWPDRTTRWVAAC